MVVRYKDSCGICEFWALRDLVVDSWYICDIRQSGEVKETTIKCILHSINLTAHLITDFFEVKRASTSLPQPLSPSPRPSTSSNATPHPVPRQTINSSDT